MKKIEGKEHEDTIRPMVLSHQPIRFETAQSWNRGRGNLNHPGKGNGGVNYPLDPWPGPHNGNGGGNGNGNGKGKKKGHG